MLDLMRNRLMRLDAAAAFIEALADEATGQGGVAAAARARTTSELEQPTRKLEALSDAVADGPRTQGLLEKTKMLEVRLAQVDAVLTAPAPRPHPDLSDGAAPSQPLGALPPEDGGARRDALRSGLRNAALDALSGLIERGKVHATPAGVTLDLEGLLGG